MTESNPQSSLPPAERAAPQVALASAAPAPTPPKPAPAKPAENPMSGLIDTIEAIIIALILALTFRAFVVEAFVIPTGSMAPTLLGAHFSAICPKCGYHFAADAKLDYQYIDIPAAPANTGAIVPNPRGELTSNTDIPCDDQEIICPNCSFHIAPSELPQYLRYTPLRNVVRDDRGRGVPANVPFVWANNGDRILVLKYLYSVMAPQRWDVIVFKEPMEAQHNFIKRLIGLPGETIEVINGDIFVGPPGHSAPPDLQIARKPPHIQDAVWQLVYDNDFYPIDESLPRVGSPNWANPWIAAGDSAKDWTIRGPVITYAANTPGLTQFSVRDPYTLNTLGYNCSWDLPASTAHTPPLVHVGDLRLETTWIPKDPSARTIALVVGLPRNQYKAVWKPEGLELFRYNTAALTPHFESLRTLSADQLPDLRAGRGYQVALNNVDRSAQVFIDGKMVLEHLTPWSAADALSEKDQIEQSRELFTQKPDLRVEVGGACTLAHLKIMRDLYYTDATIGAGRNSRARSGDPGTASTNNPLTLGTEEYFAMGDNSRRSHDGRSWAEVYPALDDLGTRRGIVPQRYLLGKAFFVYWPAGYRPYPGINIPLVPNAGDMRFIR
jgi:signal peptidase I